MFLRLTDCSALASASIPCWTGSVYKMLHSFVFPVRGTMIDSPSSPLFSDMGKKIVIMEKIVT